MIPRSGDASHIRVRIYRRPSSSGPAPVLLYLHGGGYAIGSPEDYSAIIAKFIEARDCVVIAPDYRKSFEAAYPAALDDCYDTLLWIKNNADALGVRSDQIMVGGHSAGGGLTAAVTLRARDRGDVRISFQMPIYPMIDDRVQGASACENDGPLWNSKMNRLAWGLYLADLRKKSLPIPYEAAPARATDYENLPPTMTYVGDLEPFYDETVTYIDNLKRAGVPVMSKVYRGCFHGFDMFAPNAKVSRDAREFTLECFKHAVDEYRASQA